MEACIFGWSWVTLLVYRSYRSKKHFGRLFMPAASAESFLVSRRNPTSLSNSYMN